MFSQPSQTNGTHGEPNDDEWSPSVLHNDTSDEKKPREEPSSSSKELEKAYRHEIISEEVGEEMRAQLAANPEIVDILGKDDIRQIAIYTARSIHQQLQTSSEEQMRAKTRHYASQVISKMLVLFQEKAPKQDNT